MLTGMDNVIKMWTKDLYYPRTSFTQERFVIRDTDYKIIGFIDGEENADFIINCRKIAVESQ